MRQAVILTVLCGFLALLLSTSGSAIEINFSKHTIDWNFDAGQTPSGVDLDDDGDIDVLAAALYGDEVAWWENDGSQNFDKRTIDDYFDGPRTTYAIDLDGDGDMDVLGAAFNTDDIAWWENDGDENFTKHTIDGNFDGAFDVHAIDIDGDEDVDVLGAGHYADEIAYWENDGHQNFTKHTIDDNFDAAISVFAVDLDNDGDIDVLGGAALAGVVAWWENDGAQNFTKHIIDGDLYAVSGVVGTDLDQDGDVDVLAAASQGRGFYWYENDGHQNFTPREIAYPRSIYCLDKGNVADMDLDGDLDLLAPEYGPNAIYWWENDGNQNFTKHTVTEDLPGATGAYAVDLDGDGDFDVLGTSERSDEVAWFENVPTSVVITLTPHNPPIQIPPEGGHFSYDGVVTSNTNATVSVDAWTMVFLPTGHVFGPKQLYQDIYLAPYGDSLKTISQRVKRFAPAGEYTYVGYVGYYPDTKLDSSYFNFTKLESKDFASGEAFAVFDIFGEELAFELPGTALLGAYPSPFNVQTNISYNLAQDGPVCLEVFNIEGRRVATLVDAEQPAGSHAITWDASDYSSGVYFCKLTTADFTDTKRMTLLK